MGNRYTFAKRLRGLSAYVAYCLTRAHNVKTLREWHLWMCRADRNVVLLKKLRGY